MEENVTPNPSAAQSMQAKGERPSVTRDLLHEFFHEAICRILPGIVVIALYLPGATDRSILKDGSIGLVLGLLIASWLAGIFVEVAIFCPIGLFLSSNLGDGWNWLSKMKPGWTNRLLPDIRMKTDCNETNRRFYLKFCAEKVMYRSLALIFFITSIIPPSLKREKWNLGYGAVAMALCVYAWLYARMAKLEGVTSDPEPNRSISGRFLSIVTLVLLIWIIFTFWITFHYKADCFLKLAKRFVIGQ